MVYVEENLTILDLISILAVFSSLKNALCKKKILHDIKLMIHAWSTKCRWNQKLIAQFGCNLRDERFEPN
jgi:hypothetical protein